MVVLNLTISELTYLSLLLKQDGLIGMPNMLDVTTEEEQAELQRHMDAAREMLLSRNIIKVNAEGDFDVDPDVIKLVVLCGKAEEYFTITHEDKSGYSFKVNYYIANKNAILASRRKRENYYYEFYIFEDVEPFIADASSYIQGETPETDAFTHIALNSGVLNSLLRKQLTDEDIEKMYASPEGEETDAKTEATKRFMHSVIKDFEVYNIYKNIASGSETDETGKTKTKWRIVSVSLIKENNKLWYYKEEPEVQMASFVMLSKSIFTNMMRDIFSKV